MDVDEGSKSTEALEAWRSSKASSAPTFHPARQNDVGLCLGEKHGSRLQRSTSRKKGHWKCASDATNSSQDKRRNCTSAPLTIVTRGEPDVTVAPPHFSRARQGGVTLRPEQDAVSKPWRVRNVSFEKELDHSLRAHLVHAGCYCGAGLLYTLYL